MAGKDLIPYMVQAYNGSRVPDYKAALHNDGWDAKTSAFPALVGEVLEIVWVSNSGHSGNWETHPIHAHGAHFVRARPYLYNTACPSPFWPLLALSATSPSLRLLLPTPPDPSNSSPA